MITPATAQPANTIFDNNNPMSDAQSAVQSDFESRGQKPRKPMNRALAKSIIMGHHWKGVQLDTNRLKKISQGHSTGWIVHSFDRKSHLVLQGSASPYHAAFTQSDRKISHADTERVVMQQSLEVYEQHDGRFRFNLLEIRYGKVDHKTTSLKDGTHIYIQDQSQQRQDNFELLSHQKYWPHKTIDVREGHAMSADPDAGACRLISHYHYDLESTHCPIKVEHILFHGAGAIKADGNYLSEEGEAQRYSQCLQANETFERPCVPTYDLHDSRTALNNARLKNRDLGASDLRNLSEQKSSILTGIGVSALLGITVLAYLYGGRKRGHTHLQNNILRKKAAKALLAAQREEADKLAPVRARPVKNRALEKSEQVSQQPLSREYVPSSAIAEAENKREALRFETDQNGDYHLSFPKPKCLAMSGEVFNIVAAKFSAHDKMQRDVVQKAIRARVDSDEITGLIKLSKEEITQLTSKGVDHKYELLIPGLGKGAKRSRLLCSLEEKRVLHFEIVGNESIVSN